MSKLNKFILSSLTAFTSFLMCVSIAWSVKPEWFYWVSRLTAYSPSDCRAVFTSLSAGSLSSIVGVYVSKQLQIKSALLQEDLKKLTFDESLKNTNVIEQVKETMAGEVDLLQKTVQALKEETRSTLTNLTKQLEELNNATKISLDLNLANARKSLVNPLVDSKSKEELKEVLTHYEDEESKKLQEA